MLLPGKPHSSLQALCTAEWQRKRFVIYISGSAVVILAAVDKLVQTIYLDSGPLAAVAFDESTGKIAVCAGSNVWVLEPNGRGEGYLKVCACIPPHRRRR